MVIVIRKNHPPPTPPPTPTPPKKKQGGGGRGKVGGVHLITSLRYQSFVTFGWYYCTSCSVSIFCLWPISGNCKLQASASDIRPSTLEEGAGKRSLECDDCSRFGVQDIIRIYRHLYNLRHCATFTQRKTQIRWDLLTMQFYVQTLNIQSLRTMIR